MHNVVILSALKAVSEALENNLILRKGVGVNRFLFVLFGDNI